MLSSEAILCSLATKITIAFIQLKCSCEYIKTILFIINRYLAFSLLYIYMYVCLCVVYMMYIFYYIEKYYDLIL